MRQEWYVKVDGKYYIKGNFDKGQFYNGHYVEEKPTLVENKSEATHFGMYELDKIKKQYGKLHKLEFEEFIKM